MQKINKLCGKQVVAPKRTNTFAKRGVGYLSSWDSGADCLYGFGSQLFILKVTQPAVSLNFVVASSSGAKINIIMFDLQEDDHSLIVPKSLLLLNKIQNQLAISNSVKPYQYIYIG